jgi:hypothetical protein
LLRWQVVELKAVLIVGLKDVIPFANVAVGLRADLLLRIAV